MNTCNFINSIAHGKLSKKDNLTPKNKQQVILLAQRKMQPSLVFVDLQEN